ncbi:MAG: hypothetical protein ABSG43_26305 [Solirubrobacteraceae bacterium]|jgi:hypothetical protein
MSIAVLVVILVAVAASGAAAGYWLAHIQRPPSAEWPGNVRQRVLFAFTRPGDVHGALESALRLANAERATIIPTLLEPVPRDLPLDISPSDSRNHLPPADVIRQRAAALGVPVEWRAARGRTYRDALRRLLAHEQFDHVVVSAADSHRIGLTAHDSGWLLHQGTEVVILPAVHNGNGPSLPPDAPDMRQWSVPVSVS